MTKVNKPLTILNIVVNVIAIGLSFFVLAKAAAGLTVLPFLLLLAIMTIGDGFIMAMTLKSIRNLSQEVVD